MLRESHYMFAHFEQILDACDTELPIRKCGWLFLDERMAISAEWGAGERSLIDYTHARRAKWMNRS